MDTATDNTRDVHQHANPADFLTGEDAQVPERFITVPDIVAQDGRAIIVVKVSAAGNVKTTEYAQVQTTVTVVMGIQGNFVKNPFAEYLAETGGHVLHQTTASAFQVSRVKAVKHPFVVRHVKMEELVSDLVYVNARIGVLVVIVRALSVLQDV